ncbi:MAG: hypothetical protein AAF192_12055 [Pseudomonadota bacterium]
MNLAALHPSLGVTRADGDLEALMAVLADLDPADRREADMEGLPAADPEALAQGFCAATAGGGMVWVVWHAPDGRGADPFAICAMGPAQGPRCAHVGFVSRPRSQFRRPLGCLGVWLRRSLPAAARTRGARRLEARCWAEHPTGPGWLQALGFAREGVLRGYGLGGADFELHALTVPSEQGSSTWVS